MSEDNLVLIAESSFKIVTKDELVLAHIKKRFSAGEVVEINIKLYMPIIRFDKSTKRDSWACPIVIDPVIPEVAFLHGGFNSFDAICNAIGGIRATLLETLKAKYAIAPYMIDDDDDGVRSIQELLRLK
jgi:hypothetical protein